MEQYNNTWHVFQCLYQSGEKGAEALGQGLDQAEMERNLGEDADKWCSPSSSRVMVLHVVQTIIAFGDDCEKMNMALCGIHTVDGATRSPNEGPWATS